MLRNGNIRIVYHLHRRYEPERNRINLCMRLIELCLSDFQH